MMFKIGAGIKNLQSLTKVNYADLGYHERKDIQEWVEQAPNMLGEDLLIIRKEFVLNEIEHSSSTIRIDLLALDKEGKLVIIELKRDNSGRHAEWQSIKYASYCANMTVDEIYTTFADYRKYSIEDAKKEIEEFLDLFETDDIDQIINKEQRIILVANEFHADAVSAVLWLIEKGIDISCIKITPYIDQNKDLFLSPVIMIPLPEAKDYLKKKEAKIRNKISIANTISFDKGNYNLEELEEKLLYSLSRDSSLTSRLISFLEILLLEDKVFEREEIKQLLYEKGIGENIGQTGRFMSNISQFFTKKANNHLRQILEFEADGLGAGLKKDSFKIITEYRDVVRKVIDNLNQKEFYDN